MSGAQVKARRLAMQLTQVELAALLGLSSQTISNIENERFPIENPTMLHLALSYLELQHSHKAKAKPPVSEKREATTRRRKS